jgi:excisionase family DNA binding protein
MHDAVSVMVTRAAVGTEHARDLKPIPDISALSGVLSACEAAAALGVTERTVRRAIARGELPAVKCGRAFRITREALDRYRRHRRAQPGRSPGAQASLPAPLTSFVGRERQIAEVSALAQRSDVRLLTLTGPGGVGKTRLALQVIERAAAAFPDGAVFVPLASISQPELVLPSVAWRLGFRERADEPPIDRLRRRLRDKRLLLVLDNVEQIPGVGPELVQLLAACPGATLLVTSRSLLRVSGEIHVPVPPLQLADPSLVAGNDPAAIADVEAVRLFLDRARAVAPDLAWTAESARTSAAICERLDGLPLALELAAARTRHLAPGELLARLDRALPLLTGGPRDAPGRLQSMRDAIAWSYDLLAPAEQTLFRGLAVFVGGFTLDAAEAVTEGVPPERSGGPSVLDALAALIDQNLVQRREDARGETRYAMLETVREFGRERLAASGEETRLRDAHADWCFALADRASPELSGPEQAAWFARLDAEQPNMRAALAWLLSRQDAERGVNLAGALTWFWTSRGHLTEAAAWFDALFALPVPIDPVARARGLLEAANVVHWQGHDEQAAALAEEALGTFRAHGDSLWAGYALRRLGSIAIHRGDLAGAAALLAESGEILGAVGSPWDAAFARQLAGRLAIAGGDQATALRCFEEAAEAFWRVGDRGYVAAARGHQGAAALMVGDAAAARRAYAESLAVARELDDPAWIAWSLAGAAHLARRGGDAAPASRLFAAAKYIKAEAGQRRMGDGLSDEILDALPAGIERDRDAALLSEPAIAEAMELLSDPAGPNGAGACAGPALTPREREVLRLLVDGLSDKEIAAALSIARHTASNHVTAIRDKLDAPSRAAVAVLAVRERLV